MFPGAGATLETDVITTLAVSSWVLGLLTAAFLFVCVLLVLTILIQKPQGGGLGGAFGAGGGGSSGQTAFGARTGDALTIATIVMFVVFLGTAIGLNFASRPGAFETPTTVSSTEAPQPGAESGGAGGIDDGTSDAGVIDTPDAGGSDSETPSDESPADDQPADDESGEPVDAGTDGETPSGDGG